MDIVLDTSSIINLINGAVFDRILTIEGCHFFIGDQVFNTEVLNSVQKIIVEALIEKRKLILIESGVTVSQINDLKIKYRLGMGETECMALCKVTGKSICTDDLRARKASVIEFGESLVSGSLAMLKTAVRSGKLSCLEAITSYAMMIEKGGFLPKGLNENYFCR